MYERNRQAPIHLRIDDMAIYINDRITRRGIARGLISIQEDLNKNLLDVEKLTLKALLSGDNEEKSDNLKYAEYLLKINVWSDIRFLMINRAISPGEITELIRLHLAIIKDLEKWISSINKAMSAQDG